MSSTTVDSPVSSPVRTTVLPCVLGFAAPIEGGKAEVSIAVAQRLNVPWVSFGVFLRKLAEQRGLSVTREVLQDLGEALVCQDVRAFCAQVVGQQKWQPGMPIVIDGVRHREVLEVLREMVAPEPEYLIYINIDRATQSKRLQHDKLPHQKPLEILEQHPTEIQIRGALLDEADLILDGTLPTDKLVEKVLEFVNSSPSSESVRGWKHKNARRIALAKKKNREGLTPAELAEFDQVQTWFSRYLDAKHPRTPLDMSKLDQIEARLKSDGKSVEGS